MNIRARAIGCAFVMLSLPLLAADALQVKTGLWETTITSTLTGMAIPPEQLAKLQPAQRAQMEQMMKQMRQGAPHTEKDRSCITQKDLQKGAFANPASRDGNCTYTQVSGTARHQEWVFQCSGAEGKATGKMTVDAPDSAHMQGTIEMQSARGNASIRLTGQWLSASCAGAERD